MEDRLSQLQARWRAWEEHRDRTQDVFEFDDYFTVDDLGWLLSRVEALEEEMEEKDNYIADLEDDAQQADER